MRRVTIQKRGTYHLIVSVDLEIQTITKRNKQKKELMMEEMKHMMLMKKTHDSHPRSKVMLSL